MKEASCPCRVFRSLDSIEVALRHSYSSCLEGEEQAGVEGFEGEQREGQNKPSVRSLVDWLSGSTAPCSSSGAGGCAQRSKTSLLILNAIRDACRPYLEDDRRSGKPGESPAAIAHQHHATTPRKGQPSANEQTYEEAFPSLASSTAPAPPLPSRKPRRRIRPATVASISALGSTAPKGNLINAPAMAEALEGAATALILSTRNVHLPSSTDETATTPTKTKIPASQPTSPKRANRSPQRKLNAVAQENKNSIADVKAVKNLCLLYCTLIESFLIPSTALEFQLLLQLLTVESKNSTPPAVQATPPPGQDEAKECIAQILSSPVRCQCFATESLRKLERVIVGLFGPTVVLPELSQCPPIRRHCPDLAAALEQAWQQQQQRTSRADLPGMDGAAAQHSLTTNRSALYTLPFNPARDSRNNFRTRDELAMYRNREETRDVFMTQLRVFLSLRGNVAADNSVGRIKLASLHMVSNLSDANLGWFAEFFCDMLLQIGLVPLEETDSDLLRIANQEKLQKLHQRFTSKNQQSNRTPRNLVDDAKLELSSPELEAQQLFPGHQAFFFVFLRAVDSHRLACHVQAKLAATLCRRSTTAKEVDAERQVLELCLLARFLGVLVFSPNWQLDEQSPHNVRSGYCGLTQLSAIGVSPLSLVHDAWETRRLAAVVPWVVDMLKLAKRDAVTLESQGFRELGCLFRDIQVQLWSASDDGSANLATAVVKMTLETFFGEVAGISRFQVPRRTPELRVRSPLNAKGTFDDAFRGVGRQTLFYFNSHLEGLVDLVANLSRADLGLMKSPGASRKLRPLPLAPSPMGGTLPNPGPGQPSLRLPLAGDENDSIQTKLRDAFFHQHSELKDVCEFVAGRALKAAMSTVSIEGSVALSNDETYERYRKALVDHLRRALRQALESLVSSPPPSRSAVEVAISVTTGHALRSCDAVIRAKAAEHCMTVARASAGEVPSRQLFTVTPTESPSVAPPNAATKQGLRALALALKEVTSEAVDGTDDSALYDTICAARRNFELVQAEDDKRVPADADLRSFYQAVLDLDARSGAILDRLLVPPAEAATSERWLTLEEFLRIAMELQDLSHRGLLDARSRVAQPEVVERLVWAGATQALDDGGASLASLLSDLLAARWVSAEALQLAESKLRSGSASDGSFQLLDVVAGVLKSYGALQHQ